MIAGPKWVFWLIIGGALGALAVGGYIGACQREQAGAKADLVLADTLAYQQAIEAQGQEITSLDSIIAVRDRQLEQARVPAAKAVKKGDNLVKAAQTIDTASALVPGITPHDSIVRLTASREMWRKAALHGAQVTVPLLQRQIEAQAAARLAVEARADTLESQRDFARNRVTVVTNEFRDYREETRRGPTLDFGLFTLSGTVAKVARCTLAAGAVAGMGAVVSRDDRALGAALGGTATVVGCLAG
jgi:hypothetical protein